MKVIELKDMEYVVRASPVRYVIGFKAVGSAGEPQVRPVAMFIEKDEAETYIQNCRNPGLSLFWVTE